MLTTQKFLARLSSLNVQISVDGERLRCSAPKGVLTEALRAELADRKAELVAWLQTNGSAKVVSSAPSTGEAELSWAQQRVWFVAQLQPGNPAYNLPLTLRFVGVLNVGALQASLCDIVRRHEPLRTVFRVVDGRPTPVVIEPTVVLDIVDLRGHPPSAGEAEARRRLIDDARRPFDLSAGPLFRVTLVHLAEEVSWLLFALHHIAGDAWSIAIIARELPILYQAHAAGMPLTLPALPAQYSEVVRRQQERIDDPVLQDQAAYWRAKLTPPPPVLELPSDRPRPPMQTFDGAVESFVLPPALTEALKRLGRAHGTTLFMTLLASFVTLLHRYTGVDDVAVGVPVANRTGLEAEAIVGLLANTVVIRVDLRDDPTFVQLLRRVREVASEAFANQDMPFERIVEMVQPARDMSRSPLVQVMFMLHDVALEEVTLPGLTVSREAGIRNGTARTDLTLEIMERADRLHVSVEYNTDLFDVATIQRFGEHLRQLLTAVAEDAVRPISRLPLLTDEEWRRAVVEWNATEGPLPTATMPALFAARATQSATGLAACCGDEWLTYAELGRRSERLARRLRRLGVGPDVLVGILLERSLDMLVTLLGVSRAGGAYVPLDPAYPRERLEFMLSDAAIRLVVADQRLVGALNIPAGTQVVMANEDHDGDDGAVESGPLPPPDPDDLAYVIYTSGSTGRPKGVEVRHRSLANLLVFFQRTPGLGPDDVLLAVTTLSFDIAALELFLPLVSGAHVVIAERDAAVDATKLMALQERHGVTVMQATPATWRMLLDAGWAPRPGLKLLCGGEALAPEIARRLLAAGVRLWNVYGPTETTVWSTLHEVHGVDGAVSIGRPIANTRTYVLDLQGELVPIGVPGELHIGGIGVARGYLNRSELTAQCFVADRFSTEPAARLYRTGDLVRYRANGCLEFLGRLDHQVKVRGFRIELGEIESVLAQEPGIAEAVVIAREDRPGERYLAAYVRTSSARVELAEWRAGLRQRLPEYMVPSTFTVLPAFPLTPNGKVDRRRLPAPEAPRAARGRFQRPGSDVERTIAGAWRQALRIEDVGADDNFFDLGGHSLLLVQIQARLRTDLRREIPIVDMFQYPTVRALAAHLVAECAVQPTES